MDTIRFEFTPEQTEALRKAVAFDITPEQQEQMREIVENARKAFEAIIEEMRKIAQILIEAFCRVKDEYQYRRSPQYKRDQAEYWFWWSQSKHLLIE